MRISGQSALENSIGSQSLNVSQQAEKKGLEGSEGTEILVESIQDMTMLEHNEETKVKVRQAVHTMNEFLETANSSSEFVYHEGLDRYYVTVVNKETQEIVKEIPPRKLLDAFYEMQKMLGIIVDEKI